MLLVQARPERPGLDVPHQLPDRGDRSASGVRATGATRCSSRWAARFIEAGRHGLPPRRDAPTPDRAMHVHHRRLAVRNGRHRGARPLEPDPPRRSADLPIRIPSRVKPRLQFARFKTHGGYAELRTDALRFTEAEIAECSAMCTTIRSIREPSSSGAALKGGRRPSSCRGLAPGAQNAGRAARFIDRSPQRPIAPSSTSLPRRCSTSRRRNAQLSANHLDSSADHARACRASCRHSRRPARGVDRPRAPGPVHEPPRWREGAYRYHNLFREFLERRLRNDRALRAGSHRSPYPRRVLFRDDSAMARGHPPLPARRSPASGCKAYTRSTARMFRRKVA